MLPRPLSAQSSSTSSIQRRPKWYRFLSRSLITAPVWQSHAPVAQPPTHHGSMDTQYGLRSTRRYRASRLSIDGFPFLSARCQPCLRYEPRCFDLVRRHRLRKHLLRRFCGPTQTALHVPRIHHAANLFFHRFRYEVCLAQCTEYGIQIRLQIPIYKYGQFTQQTPPSTRAIAHALRVPAFEDVHSGSCGSSRHDATHKHHDIRTSTDPT